MYSVTAKLKGINTDVYTRILKNISSLRNKYKDLEITYKFLVHPYNINSIYEAVENAKLSGCSFFHLRPVGKTWDNLGESIIFSEEDVSLSSSLIDKARKDFEDDNFKVFGIIHKFGVDWDIKHSFNKCYAVGMTCVISPDNVVELCCDRRGDIKTNLCNFVNLEEIKDSWSSKKHFEILENINLSDCPRCTYTPHNEIFEHFIINDSTCKYFI